MFSKLNTWHSQLRKGTLELSLLALLNQHEQYAYDLIHQLSGLVGPTFKKGTIYPLLSRLQKENLIESRWQESKKGPPRKYYCLTQSGKHLLDDMVGIWDEFKSSIDSTIGNGKQV
ncbi:PadR family transcriptional regulator [candidate division KSB1 bacterium]|nr:PadR family transcriptional regulator [candidate division KSB1 bacterium]